MDGFHPGPGSHDRSVSDLNGEFYHLIMGSYSQFEVDSMRRNAESIGKSILLKDVLERTKIEALLHPEEDWEWGDSDKHLPAGSLRDMGEDDWEWSNWEEGGRKPYDQEDDSLD